MSSQWLSGYCDPRFQPVADVFARALESGYEVGASLAVEYRGERIIDLFGGYRDAAKTRPWQADTLVNVFSVTKGLVATCAARLIEQQKLDVERPVADYWPEYGCCGKQQTTVSDVLCHRAAMFGFRQPIPKNQWRDWSLFTDLLAAQQPFREPGISQSYHALTFGWLVGELIRRVDGRSVGRYFAEEIAAPLNLDFKIGIDLSDMERCADQLMAADDKTASRAVWLARIPDWLLPKRLRDIKAAVALGDYQIAFGAVRDAADVINTQEWRMAEVPAANGHGTAASLATLYGVLASGGVRGDYHLLTPKTINWVTQVHSSGPDGALFGLPYQFGLGYMVDSPMTPISLAKGRFGHSGIGGEVAFGDCKNQLGFAFLNNQQHGLLNLYQTANQLSKALYQAL